MADGCISRGDMMLSILIGMVSETWIAECDYGCGEVFACVVPHG